MFVDWVLTAQVPRLSRRLDQAVQGGRLHGRLLLDDRRSDGARDERVRGPSCHAWKHHRSRPRRGDARAARHIAAASSISRSRCRRCTSAAPSPARSSSTAIYNELMRQHPGGQSPDTFVHVEGPRLHDPVRDPGGAWASCSAPTSTSTAAGGPARRASRLRQSRHRGLDRRARPRPVDGGGHGAGRTAAAATTASSTRCLSDGEVQEGSTWEATLMASSLGARQHRRLHRQQRFPEPRPRRPRRIPHFYPLVEKFRRLRLGVRRDRRPRLRRRSARPSPAAAAAKPLMVIAQDRQGQGRQLHGERADLALPLAQQGRVRAGACSELEQVAS